MHATFITVHWVPALHSLQWKGGILSCCSANFNALSQCFIYLWELFMFHWHHCFLPSYMASSFCLCWHCSRWIKKALSPLVKQFLKIRPVEQRSQEALLSLFRRLEQWNHWWLWLQMSLTGIIWSCKLSALCTVPMNYFWKCPLWAYKQDWLQQMLDGLICQAPAEDTAPASCFPF